MCRPEAFKVINNSVLLYLTLSLVKKKKKTIINSILNVSWKINFKCAAPQYNNPPSLPPHLHKNYGSFLSTVGRGRYRGIGDKIGKLLSEIAISFDGHASTFFVTDFSFITILSLTSRLLH